MESSTSSQANQPYSPINRVSLDLDFEQLMYSQEFYPTQDYSIAQGSAHGSAPVDDDDSLVEEMSTVKAKKPSKRASKAKKNDTNKTPKDWTMAEEIALCQAWCDVSENSEKENSMKAKRFWDAVIKYFKKESGSTRGYDSILSKCKNKVLPNNIEQNHENEACWNILKDYQASGGFNLNNEADESEEETQEHRPMGCDRSKAKKQSFASSREGSSSFVDLVADKLFNIKLTK
ncbi:hypothetical protein Tco_0597236 [Tanacetum coccineum]